MTLVVDEAILNATFKAAIDAAHDHTSPESQQYLSDDGLDYLQASLDFARLMLELYVDGDVARLQAIFDARGLFIAFYGGEMPTYVTELDIPANDDEFDYDGPAPEEIR